MVRTTLVALVMVVLGLIVGSIVSYLVAPGKTVTTTSTVFSATTTTKTLYRVTTAATVTVYAAKTVAPAKPLTLNLAAMIEQVKPKLSPQTRRCIECHYHVTPGIVAEWLLSKHAHTTPLEALSKPSLLQEISGIPPEPLRNHVVGCYECHGLNPDEHKDTFQHFGFRVHVVVTPKDCSVCHPVEVKEYERSVKANAYLNLVKNPVYNLLAETVTSIASEELKAGGELARESSCYMCHGSVVKVVGYRTVTYRGQTTRIPVLSGWPNHGVGRINPDGSKGSCTACHPRHSFSIAVARSPYTCAQCHLDPDVPGFDVWKESKHGNIFLEEWKTYNMTSVPWTPGKDFRSPSCAVCHFSLLVAPDGKVIAKRTHDVGSRIWLRIFGVYAHPQPKTGETWKIRNKAGLPLPYDLATGEPAKEYLISSSEMDKRRQEMIRICSACHAEEYARERIEWFENVVKETNNAVKIATLLLVKAWKENLAKGLPQNANPFDEPIENMWIKTWLFYANSIRYGAAMSGPDYTTFKRGWYKLATTIAEMNQLIEILRATKAG